MQPDRVVILSAILHGIGKYLSSVGKDCNELNLLVLLFFIYHITTLLYTTNDHSITSFLTSPVIPSQLELQADNPILPYPKPVLSQQ